MSALDLIITVGGVLLGFAAGWLGGYDHAETNCYLKHRRRADAVLAAVADHDGLADVLAKHHHCYDRDCGEDEGCSCGAINDYYESNTTHAAHLADVVRAWLRDQT